jgi:hypothetical protein
MLGPQHKGKAEEEKPREFKKTPEYRRFKKLLKQVIKAPPMPRHKPETARGDA